MWEGENGRGRIASRNTERLPCTDAEPLAVKRAHKALHSCVVMGDRELNQCLHIQCVHLL